MRKAVNLRLNENSIITLETLSHELHSTKTQVIEKALHLLSQSYAKPRNSLLTFAGALSQNDADAILETLEHSKDTKPFTLDL